MSSETDHLKYLNATILVAFRIYLHYIYPLVSYVVGLYLYTAELLNKMFYALLIYLVPNTSRTTIYHSSISFTNVW